MKITIPQNYIDDGLIRVQKHPKLDLYIYNYTEKVQYSKLWDEYTLICRGLILDGEGNIVARPFKKFFNLSEMDKLPAGEPKVFEKMDGSLGILYWEGDTPKLATRGSFTSDQAIVGTKILHSQYAISLKNLNKNHTYLFEIIYPENRIVVNYGKEVGLYLLAVLDIETGKEVETTTPFCKPSYFGIMDTDALKKMEIVNAEGFVLKWTDGTMAKFKFEEYVRLHRLLTGISNKSIWEILKTGDTKAFEELLTKVPDEYYDWVESVRKGLNRQYYYILEESEIVYEQCRILQTRKEQAQYILEELPQYAGVVFALLDSKDYQEIIWRMIKPAVTSSFKVTTEDV